MKQTVRRSKSQWETILREQEKSGLSAKRFCDRESIRVSNFYRWRSRLSGGPSPSENTDESPVFIDMGSVGLLDEEGDSNKAEAKSSNARVFEVALDLGDGVTLTLRHS